MPLARGEVFAGYRILRPLGFGGMGEVYLAQHPRLPRQDALKILPAEMSADAEFRARFNREAELAAALYNPHIVGVHDRGEWAGQLWISMDYIDGPDAGRLLREQCPAGMPPPDVVEIVAAVADALDHAHDRGLLHRDVKPPNILLTQPERGRRRVLLGDFGIARDSADSTELTGTNITLGTVNYAAPEQLMGSPLDGRADQYGLAATAFHLLTGSPVFGSSNPAVVIGHHLNAAPPPLSVLRPDLAGLDPVMARALSKRPVDRYPTCGQFADALRRGLQTPPPPRSAGAPPPVPPPTAVLPRVPHPEPDYPPAAGRAPSRGPWLLAGAVLAVLLAALVFAVWPTRQDQSVRPATPVTSTARPSPTPSVSAAVPTTSTSGAATSTPEAVVSFESMGALVNGFYAQLPANPAGAWNDLDEGYRQRNGWDGFTGFWSTIEAVEVLSVSRRDATSVVARLRYTLRGGGMDTEDRWLSMAIVGGRLLIRESERIGPA